MIWPSTKICGSTAHVQPAWDPPQPTSSYPNHGTVREATPPSFRRRVGGYFLLDFVARSRHRTPLSLSLPFRIAEEQGLARGTTHSTETKTVPPLGRRQSTRVQNTGSSTQKPKHSGRLIHTLYTHRPLAIGIVPFRQGSPARADIVCVCVCVSTVRVETLHYWITEYS